MILLWLEDQLLAQGPPPPLMVQGVELHLHLQLLCRFLRTFERRQSRAAAQTQASVHRPLLVLDQVVGQEALEELHVSLKNAQLAGTGLAHQEVLHGSRPQHLLGHPPADVRGPH